MAGRVLALILAGALLLGWAPAPSPRVGRDPSAFPRAAAAAAPPTPALLQQFDLTIAALTPQLIAWQTSYALAHRGGYFQGLRSHSAIPADGAAASPDRLTSKPTDQADTLTSFWEGAGLPAKTPFALSVNVYDGPQGRGFEVVYLAVVGGQTYSRIVNVGPETQRETPWAAVLPD